MFYVMAPMPSQEAAELAARIDRAFRRALAVHGISLKAASIDMGLNESQLCRMLQGKENFSLARAMRLGPDVFGDFLASLLDEVGGWNEVLARGLVVLLEPLLANRGLARMARASLSASQESRTHVA